MEGHPYFKLENFREYLEAGLYDLSTSGPSTLFIFFRLEKKELGEEAKQKE
jgi:hypothetical protein